MDSNLFLADAKIALCIGNNNYSRNTPLSFCHNDAQLISDLLAKLGYRTQLLFDQT
jgi:hypothetical protein